MASTHDAIIIGAGVIGCSIAFHLAKKGYRTLNVDGLPAAGYGSTSSSCAVIRVYYSTLDATAMAYQSFHDWRVFRDYLGAPAAEDLATFIQTGTLVMKTPANGMLAAVASHMAALGIPHEDWDGEKIRATLPGYCLDSFAPARPLSDETFGEPNGGRIPGGIYIPAGGYVDDPQLAARNFKTAAERHGARFVFGQKAIRITASDNRITGAVLEDGTVLSAPIVVNAAGPHSGMVNALVEGEIGLRIGTRPLRQEVVQVQPPPGLGYGRTGLIVSDSDISCYIKPGSGGHLMIGSENPACDPAEEVDPDAFSRDMSDRAVTYACRYGQRLPDLKIPPHPVGVADVYDASDDWLPIYDRSAVDGFYLAIGTSGNQFKNAPIAGRLIAKLVEHCEAGHDHDRQPMQLPLRHIGHVLDTGGFSRLREPTKASSFSVLG